MQHVSQKLSKKVLFLLVIILALLLGSSWVAFYFLTGNHSTEIKPRVLAYFHQTTHVVSSSLYEIAWVPSVGAAPIGFNNDSLAVPNSLSAIYAKVIVFPKANLYVDPAETVYMNGIAVESWSYSNFTYYFEIQVANILTPSNFEFFPYFMSFDGPSSLSNSSTSGTFTSFNLYTPSFAELTRIQLTSNSTNCQVLSFYDPANYSAAGRINAGYIQGSYFFHPDAVTWIFQIGYPNDFSTGQYIGGTQSVVVFYSGRGNISLSLNLLLPSGENYQVNSSTIV